MSSFIDTILSRKRNKLLSVVREWYKILLQPTIEYLLFNYSEVRVTFKNPLTLMKLLISIIQIWRGVKKLHLLLSATLMRAY